MTVKAYMHASIIRVAAGYILHGIHADHLEKFIDIYVNTENIDAYSKDAEYGPDGTCAEYWLLPGLNLDHIGSIGHNKRRCPDGLLEQVRWMWNYPPSYYVNAYRDLPVIEYKHI